MPVYLIFLWILLLLVAVLFIAVRIYGKRSQVDVELAAVDTAVVAAEDVDGENDGVPSLWQEEQVRWLVAVLFSCAVLFVWMGQAIYKEIPKPEQWAVYGFMGFGLLVSCWEPKRPLLKPHPNG